MKNNRKTIENRFINRRQFLIGSGKTLLSLPPLLSLMPEIVSAQILSSKKVRSVVYAGYLGIDKIHMDPNPADLIQGPGHSTFYKPLASFSGPISRMIDTSFSPLYPYMNLIKGLSLTGSRYQGHSNSFLAGAHSQGRNPTWGRTLDVVMEKSSNVYKSSDFPVAKALRISSSNGTPSYDTQNGVEITSSFLQGDLGVFNLLFANLTDNVAGPSESDLKNELVVDRVFSDLKKLENDRRLSGDDKKLLDRYMTGIFELQKKIKANNSGEGASCSKPNLNLQVKGTGSGLRFPQHTGWGINSTNLMFDNYIEMIKLAFLCDLTRVVVIENMIWDDRVISPGSEGGLHHECPSSETSADRHQYGLKQMAKLATAFMSTPDTLNGGGNLLDNSTILFTNELGDWTTGHNTFNMPCVLFGKGGGLINTGYFVDYSNHVNGVQIKHQSGRPYKQILQTIMRSVGVTKSEYMQFGDGKGYGEFVEGINQFGKVHPSAFTAYRNEHNDLLPFLTNT